MSLRSGVAKTDLTPPVGVELCGYGFYLERRSTGVLDPLHAKALVVDDGASRAALVACDLIGLMPRTVNAARALIEDAVGLPGSHVMFACSHTHAGPATIDVSGCGVLDEAYVATLPELLARAVIDAANSTQEATVAFARGSAEGLALNRVEGDAGPMDDEVVVMQLCAEDGALATVYNVAAHGVTHRNTNTGISADWPGVAARVITDAGGGEALFLQGSCGDVNPVLVHTGRYEEAGRLAGEAVVRASASLQEADEPTVAGASQIIELPFDVTPAEDVEAMKADAQQRLASLADTQENRAARSAARLDLEAAEHLRQLHADGPPPTLETEIQVLRVGDALFLGHGGELFVEFGLALKGRFASRPVFAVGYANNFVGYIPDPEDFARGGYAAATVPKMCGHFPFTSDVGERLVREMEKLAGGVI